jgi:molecular chaperone HtpG
MDKCADLLPDYFSFVRGLVDSQDLSLNISRELLQHDRQLKIIAKSVEKKIKNELSKMLKSDRENYEKFFKAFGLQLKFGIYQNYGMNKDVLQDLLLFTSSEKDENGNHKLVTLKEYVDRMKPDQKYIFFASGENIAKALRFSTSPTR